MRLSYQPENNSLRLTLDRDDASPERRLSVDGYVDMGVGGRIVGVEALSTDTLNLGSALDRWLADETAAEYVSVDGDSAYIELSAPEESDVREQIRAVEASLSVDLDHDGNLIALSIPRHGAGYEISYPSGNQ